jgi:hypothetical protein
MHVVVCQHFFPFLGYLNCHFVYVADFVGRHLSWFCILDIVKNAGLRMYIQMSLEFIYFGSFEHIPGCGISESCNSIFFFLR